MLVLWVYFLPYQERYYFLFNSFLDHLCEIFRNLFPVLVLFLFLSANSFLNCFLFRMSNGSCVSSLDFVRCCEVGNCFFRMKIVFEGGCELKFSLMRYCFCWRYVGCCCLLVELFLPVVNLSFL